MIIVLNNTIQQQLKLNFYTFKINTELLKQKQRNPFNKKAYNMYEKLTAFYLYQIDIVLVYKP